MKKAYLYLENGQVLEGRSFGASGTATGELVFTTGMTGCVESLTDPSYYGQLVVYTFPQFGNYGICHKDKESPHCQMGGVVVREYCENPSNFRCEETVDAFLKSQNVVGIAGVDTRMLTQLLRDGGVLNAVITTEEAGPDLEALKAYRVTQSVENTSEKEIHVRLPEGGGEVLRGPHRLRRQGEHRQLPAGPGLQGHHLSLQHPRRGHPGRRPRRRDALQRPRRPGGQHLLHPTDPEALWQAPHVRHLPGPPDDGSGRRRQDQEAEIRSPGANQPAMDLETGEVSITSQNHGYAVDEATLPGTEGKLRFVNVNDGTCEGVDYPAYHAFSLQFHPEAHGGPWTA